MTPETAVELRKLYPDLSDAELTEGGEILDRYLAVVLRIYERLALNSQPAKLTPSDGTVSYPPSEPGASG